ncbi:Late embryogenesis abundant protein Lea14-A [Acorus gramineus]|uniref:Late embryogenesis abundant protein Lea14-A n=1 Tax=Acorus gramineus TaxID=55184 RepID=A0AAV9BKI9_ACOGR|nr:Late embryogenesis abundant protein Lea14-A [Acorus gramineus]
MAQLVDKAKNWVSEKVANVKKPEAELGDVSVKNVSRDSANFTSQLHITNPYGHDIPICEISYTLKSADRVLASGTMPDPGSIEGSKTTTLEVPLKVPYNFLVSLMRDIGKDWDIDYQLDLALTIDLPLFGNFTIPLSKKGETKLPTLSDIF